MSIRILSEISSLRIKICRFTSVLPQLVETTRGRFLLLSEGFEEATGVTVVVVVVVSTRDSGGPMD